MGTTVLVGTVKGLAVLRSDSERRSWEIGPLQHKGWVVTAATRDAAGRVSIGLSHEVYGATIQQSENLEDWDAVESMPQFGTNDTGNDSHLRIIGATDPFGKYAEGKRYIDQVWKLHADSEALYAGVSEAGVFRSDDRGKSWRPLVGLNDHPTRSEWEAGFGGLCAHSVLTDANDPRRIWVGISAAGVFRSDDGGRTFEPKNDGVAGGIGFCVHGLAHDPKQADVIYRQDHRGVYVSRNGGDDWSRSESGLPIVELSEGLECSFGFAVAADIRSGDVFLVPLEGDAYRFPAAGELRVYRSRDGGQSWQGLSSGLPTNFYSNVLRGAIGVDGADPCGVYLGSTSGSVFGSPDLGESWSEIARGLPRILCVEAFCD